MGALTLTFPGAAAPQVHRIDVPCESAGFTPPPFDVHIKLLPSAVDDGWTLVAHAAAGKADVLATWLKAHPGMGLAKAAPGLAPKLLRARTPTVPPAWANVGAFVKIHHLDLAPDGSASWFVEGTRERVWALVRHLEVGASKALLAAAADVRCRPVNAGGTHSPISRRQFEALSSAVALGYYEIPHRLDLRALALRSGISLGAVSELLRRAEGAVLTQYVDTRLMHWPAAASEEPLAKSLPPGLTNMLRL